MILLVAIAGRYGGRNRFLSPFALPETRETHPFVARKLLGRPRIGLHGGSTDEAGGLQGKLSFFARALDIVNGFACFAIVDGRDSNALHLNFDSVAAVYQRCGEAVRGVQLIAPVAQEAILSHTFAYFTIGFSGFGIHRCCCCWKESFCCCRCVCVVLGRERLG